MDGMTLAHSSHAMENFAHDDELRQAGAAVRMSEERFHTLVQATSQIVWVTDAAGVTLDASPSFKELTGLDRTGTSGGVWLRVLHPDDRESAIAAWDYSIKNGVPYEIENRARMRDGSYRWFAVRGQPIFDQDGTIREWIGTCTDIHARKLAEQALRDSQHQYLELVEESRDGIYQRDPDGHFLFVNRAFCRMLGYEHDELLRMSIHDIANLDEQRIANCIEQTNKGEELPAMLYIRLKHNDGHEIPVETAAKRLTSGRIQVMVRDISARQDAEHRARQYLERTEELSRKLLMTQEEERRGIARELHDEVGSALTGLQMCLKTFEEDMPDRLKSMLGDCGSIVTTLLKQIRTMSLDLRPSVLDDMGLAAAMNWFVRERLRKGGLEVRLDVQAGIGRFSAEIENACFRVLQGAATNALRHGQAQNMDVTLSKSKDTLVLAVHDDGVGFDVEAARACASGGASLGLLAMEERIRLIGGEFTLDSALGCGTTVRIAVPTYGHEDHQLDDVECNRDAA